MNLFRRLRLAAAIVLLAGACFGLVVYENTALAVVGANSASLFTPTYNVGSEYSGVITQQYVSTGDSVRTGQKLFELKSDQLASELAAGTIKATSLNTPMAKDGGIILTAQHGGVVSQIAALQGSFVNTGRSIATISSNTGLSVRANFELSGPQYTKLQPTTPVRVTYGGHTVTATITGITQESSGGHTMTIVTATLPPVPASQTIYATGAPVIVHLTLNQDTLYPHLRNEASHLRQTVESYIHKG